MTHGGDNAGGRRPELPPVLHVDHALLDRQLLADDGTPVGKVDDIEFSDPCAGHAPELVALLCGPTALGPRIGGRLGTWWTAIGRRLRPQDDPQPIRIPSAAIRAFERGGVRLRIGADEAGTRRMADWTREKLVQRIPGSGADARR